MTEKTPGTPRIICMRWIILCYSKFFGAHKFVWNAHSRDWLNAGQMGSRPGWRAIYIVVQKEMKYLYSRLTRTAPASMDNDARSCYDRIICSLAMMVSQYYGMPSHSCQMQAKPFAKRSFELQLLLENRVDNISILLHPQYTDQAMPMAVDALRSHRLRGGIGWSHEHERRHKSTNYHAVAWSICRRYDAIHKHRTLESRQQSMRSKKTIIWPSLLEASRGQLVLTKCFYYILAWKFSPERDATRTTVCLQPYLYKY